jgi:RNA polymerase sigma-70 factor (ECF subfamily)
MAATTDPGAAFQPHRRYLVGLAYRMLGSLSEAEDIVQDAYLRWHGAGRADLADTRAFLATIVTRLCLDHLKSARVRRESYVGAWLPEPVLDAGKLSPETASDYAHDLSVGLLLVLERLSPLERAAFLLHDVFDMEFAQVAEVLGRNEPACRQLAARARDHVRASRPRFDASPEEAERLAAAFVGASRTGDASGLTRLLAESAVLYTDGGGKRKAALNPIHGRDKIVRFFVGLARGGKIPTDIRVRPARINGLPGFVVTEPDGAVHTTAFEIHGGAIAAIYVVGNPDKLRHIAGASLPH